ncbi:MAG TPA: hydroxyisourate hydrolase [Phycicoccus sp.]|nr:hydroxyisourate hydrolase [Phycicoccus sp.]
MSVLSTHVLDLAAGRPAAGIPVRAETREGELIGRGVTDDDGRVAAMPLPPTAGAVVLRFDLGDRGGLYPEVVVVVTLDGADERYHVPLLLSPYGYSTYRGS